MACSNTPSGTFTINGGSGCTNALGAPSTSNSAYWIITCPHTANITDLNISPGAAGDNGTVEVLQDSTGGCTLAWDASLTVNSTAKLNSTANTSTLYYWRYDGTHLMVSGGACGMSAANAGAELAFSWCGSNLPGTFQQSIFGSNLNANGTAWAAGNISGCGTATSITGKYNQYIDTFTLNFHCGTGASPATIVLTMPGGGASSTDWVCTGSDRTTAVVLPQSNGTASTTTCTIKGNVATNDVVSVTGFGL
jgi:hypothetical protein